MNYLFSSRDYAKVQTRRWAVFPPSQKSKDLELLYCSPTDVACDSGVPLLADCRIYGEIPQMGIQTEN